MSILGALEALGITFSRLNKSMGCVVSQQFSS
jgi:hypothetical protein